MEDFNTWARSFVRLTAFEQERIRLLVDSYNSAVAEMQSAESPMDCTLDGLFAQRDIERLARNFHHQDYAKMGPALQRYLHLLELYVCDRPRSRAGRVQ